MAKCTHSPQNLPQLLNTLSSMNRSSKPGTGQCFQGAAVELATCQSYICSDYSSLLKL